MTNPRETWGAAGDLELGRAVNPDVVVEVLQALGPPKNVWTQTKENVYSIEIRAYALGRDAGQAAVTAKSDHLKRQLAPYSPQVRLDELREVDDPEKEPDEVGFQ